MVKCHECGSEFQRLGTHWTQSSNCEAPPLSDRQRDIVEGCLMGDGSLNMTSKNASLIITSSTKEYLEYVDSIFGRLSAGIRLSRTAEELASADTSTVEIGNVTEDFNDSYQLITRRLPEISEYESWYDTGEKSWPESLQLTSTKLKHWYVGDGTYHKNKDYILITLSNERENREKIFSYFNEANLPEPDRWYDYGRIAWSKENSEQLLEYMGKPVPGFEYKWGKQP